MYAVPTAPFGRGLAVVITKGSVTVIDRERLAVVPALSVTSTTKLNGLPVIVVGVPLMIPSVDKPLIMPVGNDPERMHQWATSGLPQFAPAAPYCPVPPVAVSTCDAYGVPATPPGKDDVVI